MKKLLVATDGSEHAKRALLKAIEVAGQDQEAVIDLVYVVDGETSKSDVLHYGDSDTASYKREKKFKESVDLVESKGVKANLLIKHGDPEEVLIDYANSNEYDLVFVGSRGRNKFQTMVLGSVSHKLVKHIDAPVMVVK
ncbi:universal stress protein [Jeotgalibacillus malaysiensis]|uniref:Universal stress protein n=1 Tax=Jeotgalibacillus malaysiensis TaxID=1508404 RepID=A0A0B5AGN5_9BACL|nr:universal stress protein [Jeotgalibacillus malaysiensis]AJD89515.1 universal stress protein [Jeotgalibacillus malaysiensis]